jgi:4-hydroxy-3-methylbut-2-enyl diphosphate reductase IspH
MVLSAGHSQNTATRIVTVSAPELQFNMTRVYPFKRREAVGAPKWYEKIGVTYTLQSRNTISLAALCAEQVTTYHIADPDEVDVATNVARYRTIGPHGELASCADWIPTAGPLRIGVTAGASTPNNKIGETVARIFAIRGVDPATIR